MVRGGFGVYYDNLNLNELQFTRLVPPFYGQFSLQPVRTAPASGRHAVSESGQDPAVPGAVLDGSEQPDRLHDAVERQRAAHASASDYLVEVAYTGSRSYNEHKRFNINQAQPGTTPIETRVPYPAFQSAILYSSDGGWAQFNGVSFRLEKRYSSGLFFLANYQLSKTVDNGSGEIEANDTAFAWDLDADEALSRFDQRHRSAFSFGYELPFGPGRRWLSDGGVAAAVLGGWQVQGVARFASGFPFTITSTNVCQCGSFVPQRVNFAPGRRRTRAGWTTRRRHGGSTRRRTSCRPWARRGRRAATRCAARARSGSISPSPGASPWARRGWSSAAEIFNLFNHTNFGNPDATSRMRLPA